LTYVIAVVAILTVLYFGSQIMTYVPIAVMGALLIFIGLDFIDNWIIQGLDKFTQSEYLVALLIMLTVIFVGFLEGVILGTFVMLLVFVGTYSRISTVYRSVSVKNLPSTVQRNPHFTDELYTLREQVYLLELTGFLFFGQADAIVNEAKAHIHDADAPDLMFLIIDFRRVAGVDSSALLSLNKIINLAETYDFQVIFSNFEDNPSILRIIKDLSTSDRLQFTDDLDHALEKTETSLLEYAGTTQAFVATVIWMQLVEMGMDKPDAKELAKHMTREKYEPDNVIIHQGDEAHTIYFVEVGQVSIYLDLDTPNPIRLRTFTMGSVVGEIGFFTNKPRTATVVADTHAFILSLTRETLETIKQEKPELAFAFEGMMLKIVAQRLSNNNNLLTVLR
ncbi:MAG: cyclic nucleotide-binding domain-containing protein, partial [Chloroflexota bacterium]